MNQHIAPDAPGGPDEATDLADPAVRGWHESCSGARKTQIVVVGGGAGGLELARRLGA